jgi:hypothetical protein
MSSDGPPAGGAGVAAPPPRLGPLRPPPRPPAAAKPKRANPALRYGVPLVAFCGVGYYVLSQFVGNRVAMKDGLAQKKSARAAELEAAHAAIVGQLSGELEDFTLKPIPPPPEEMEEGRGDGGSGGGGGAGGRRAAAGASGGVLVRPPARDAAPLR